MPVSPGAPQSPAPAAGRIACVVEYSGREETYNARHVEQREQIRDVEQWRIWIWPESN